MVELWKTQRTKALCFDLDGTLVDSFQDMKNSVVHAWKEVFPSLPPPSDARLTGALASGKPLREFLVTFSDLNPDLHNPELVQDVIAAYRSHYAKNLVVHTKLYPGVSDVLKELRARGFLLCIATTKPPAAATKVCDLLGLSEMVDHVQGTSDFPPKPNPEVIYRSLAACSGTGVWMIGDTVPDVLAGKAASLNTFAVTTGLQDSKTLAGAEPSVLADSLYPLLDCVGVPVS